MCQTASAFSCGGAWCFTKRHYPLHRRQHHCCHSDGWQERHTVPRNRTATVRAAHAACIARSESCPTANTLRAASARTSRLALRRTCNRVLGGLVATVTFNCDPHAPFPISPSLNAADLTEIRARYARS